MNPHSVHHTLCNLYKSTDKVGLPPDEKFIIFSDLHMGSGGKRDDFKKNSRLMLYVLENYYLAQNYTLILNGDIEELQKFKLKQIMKKWGRAYDLFSAFKDNGKLIKVLGNHDLDLMYEKNYIFSNELVESLIFKYNHNRLFLFHGHQALHLHEKYHDLFNLLLRYIARPLNLKNFTPVLNSKKKYRVEKKVYEFSISNKIATIIGHTHRPLFESLSKIETLKFTIEQLIEFYPLAEDEEKKQVELDIKDLSLELRNTFKKNKKLGLRSSPYDPVMTVPTMFNSGSCIGKRGITGLEIQNGRISLVYWYGKRMHKKYLRIYEEEPVRLHSSQFHKLLIKSDDLDSIFNRIKLLSTGVPKSIICR